MSRKGLFLVLLLALVATVPWGGAPAYATAAASGDWSVTLVSLGNDYVTQGEDFFFDASNASIDPSLPDPSLVQVFVHESDTVSFLLRFGTEPGQALHPGLYVHAASYNPTSIPEPYISFAGEGRGGETSGRFRVRQISTDSQGNVTSLWLTFATGDGVLGEIRFGVPADGAVVGPRDVLWPESEIDTPQPAASIAVSNPGSQPVEFGHPTVTGANAADDTIVSNDCSGSTLNPGGLCHIEVRFQPLAVGQSTATLNVPESGGGPTHRVSLEGFVRATTTEFSLQSDPGDGIGNGQSDDFVLANATFSPQPFFDPHHRIQVDFGAGGLDYWVVTFDALDGKLTPGTTYTAGQAGTASMEVIGRRGVCIGGSGSFTVNDLEIDPWNDIVSFEIDFVAYCGTGPPSPGSPALHGSLAYQTNAVAIRHTKKQLIVSGQVAAGNQSQNVAIEVRRGSARVARRAVKLHGDGLYALKLPRPKKGTCRASATLPGTPATVAVRVSKTGPC